MRNNQKQNKNPFLIWLIGLLVIGLSVCQLYISYNLSTYGGKVKALEEKAMFLEKENRRFNQDIAQAGSLSNISSRAAELGLVRSSQVMHLVPQVPVAYK